MKKEAPEFIDYLESPEKLRAAYADGGKARINNSGPGLAEQRERLNPYDPAATEFGLFQQWQRGWDDEDRKMAASKKTTTS